MRIANASCCVASLLLVFGAFFAHALVADEPGPAGKGTIKGQVVYGGPIAKIKVSLAGPVKREEKTDEQGEFMFKDLPPGEYKLEATGIAKNNRRKGSTEVTLTDSPQEVQVKIKLQ